MGIPLRVLIIEDVDDDAELLVQELRSKGYDPLYERVDTQKAVLDALNRQTWDVVICDYSMPGFNAINALELMHKANNDVPFILVSGAIGEEVAVEVMKAGAHDYIMKDNLSRFVPAIQRELVEYKDRCSARKAEDQLRKLHRAIEHSPGSVIITDIEGRIEYVNPGFSDITGYSVEEVIGKNPRIVNSGKQTQGFYKELWDTIKSGKEWHGEFCNKKKNGELYWESASISAVKDEKGVITGYVAVKEDITERRQTEEAIQTLVKGTVGVTGQEFFDRIVSSVCEWLDADYAFIGQIVNGDKIKALSSRVNGDNMCDCTYALSGTVCEAVIKEGYCVYAEGVSKLFSINCKHFAKKEIDGYVGVLLLDKNNKPIGILWAASRLKLNIPPRTADVMDIIAAKASAEIERMHAEEQIKASLREKEVLLKEIHHRVKNNMQIISSLLNLQTESVDDENIRQILRKSQNRVKSMALVHEKLYQTEDLSSIDFGEYTRSLTARLLHSFGDKSYGVQIMMDIDEVYLDVNKAIPCGLIINEIVTNSIKHAFTARTTGVDKNKYEGKGIIKIFMRKIADCELSPEDGPGASHRSDNHIVGQNADFKSEIRNPKSEIIKLFISDNGIGLPEGLDYRNTKTLGMELVTTLVDQLKGTIEHVKDKGGTEFRITFEV